VFVHRLHQLTLSVDCAQLQEGNFAIKTTGFRRNKTRGGHIGQGGSSSPFPERIKVLNFAYSSARGFRIQAFFVSSRVERLSALSNALECWV
jgi:hypothetical protein